MQEALADTDLDNLEERISEMEATLEACESLDHVWKVSLREDSVQVTSDLLLLDDSSSLDTRVSRCEQRYDVAKTSVDERYVRQEQSVKNVLQKKSETIRLLRAAHASESKALEDRRRQLRIHEDEQRFHERRGTFVKERSAHPHVDELKKDQERGRHTVLCGNVLHTQDEVDLVMEQVKGLRRDQCNEKKEHEDRLVDIRRQLRELSSMSSSASSSRAQLEREEQELRELRSELAALLQIVRQRNRV
jgi:hypothetical protein